jgi:hypothetical protein|tara:strand:- start:2 stop:169 length:168 start_codon:yes stop_codon:yes gene_type:complete
MNPFRKVMRKKKLKKLKKLKKTLDLSENSLINKVNQMLKYNLLSKKKLMMSNKKL